MNYTKLNNIVGWVVFSIATIVYLLTMESTTSFWDCGEFITTAFKMEVGHPPGAPFFMILGRFFTLFGGPEDAGLSMNVLSALASSFTILFLFWTITHLTKRLVAKEDPKSFEQIITILGSGAVGALAYTFSDTFWFSAVEAEVYATSSLFTALVFWAILKWEDVADKPFANRWLILICYLVGLSVGVHLLNLLAIPAIVFIYYYKKYEVTQKGLFYTLVISALIVAIIMYGIIPGIIMIGTYFELAFVNGIGLPFNSGFFVYVALLIGGVALGLYYTWKKKYAALNTALAGLTMILVAYSCYMIIPIRSSANLPMDQNSPRHAFSMLKYLNRDQYGQRPLFTGQYFNSPYDAKDQYVDGKKEYIQKNGEYVVAHQSSIPNYDAGFTTILPRMWSSDARHIGEYKNWSDFKGEKKVHINGRGERQTIMMPTMGENIKFLFRYQVNFMYFRYFMWNFAGRQNDIQGHGNNFEGNWISGIKFIDEARLGSQEFLPSKYADNPARNTFFFLPLIFGLLGIFFQYKSGKQGKRDLWVVSLLFLMTGLAIVFYLNQSPLQPRERDYAYAGSFYAFAIWIGMGVAGLTQILKKYAPERIVSTVVLIVALIAVPGRMAAEGWDDHNRHGRYSARDFGQNYLNSIESGGVIFTNGDNDTYPLWYNQEVEGVGIDKRVCNLSYFQTDWYTAQMKRKFYDSEPLPITFEKDQFVTGTNDVVWVDVQYYPRDHKYKDVYLELDQAIKFIKSTSKGSKISSMDNASYLPTNKLKYKVDKQAAIDQGVVSAENAHLIVDTMYLELEGQYISKDQLMVLDMLNSSNWSYPLYYAVSVSPAKHMGLGKYFRCEGLAYRVVPIRNESRGYALGFIDSDIMYENMVNKFKYGNLKGEGVYVDENNRRMCTNLRNNLNRLAQQLIIEGKMDKAKDVADLAFEELPISKIPYDYFCVELASIYYEVDEKEKAEMLFSDMANEFKSEIDYYFSFRNEDMDGASNEIRSNYYYLSEMMMRTKKYGDDKNSQALTKMLDDIQKSFNLL